MSAFPVDVEIGRATPPKVLTAIRSACAPLCADDIAKRAGIIDRGGLARLLHSMEGAELRTVKVGNKWCFWPSRDPLPDEPNPIAVAVAAPVATPPSIMADDEDDPPSAIEVINADLRAAKDALANLHKPKTEQEPAMPRAKEPKDKTELRRALETAMLAVAAKLDAGEKVTGNKLGQALGIAASAAAKRLSALKKQGLLSNDRGQGAADWVITELGRTALMKYGYRRPTPPAPQTDQIVDVNKKVATPSEAPPSQYTGERVAITDCNELLIFSGHPATPGAKVSIIPTPIARRIAALFRALPSTHPLHLEN